MTMQSEAAFGSPAGSVCMSIQHSTASRRARAVSPARLVPPPQLPPELQELMELRSYYHATDHYEEASEAQAQLEATRSGIEAALLKVQLNCVHVIPSF